jgi:hypothetical protein
MVPCEQVILLVHLYLESIQIYLNYNFDQRDLNQQHSFQTLPRDVMFMAFH